MIALVRSSTALIVNPLGVPVTIIQYARFPFELTENSIALGGVPKQNE